MSIPAYGSIWIISCDLPARCYLWKIHKQIKFCRQSRKTINRTVLTDISWEGVWTLLNQTLIHWESHVLAEDRKVSPLPQLICHQMTADNQCTTVSLALLCYSIFPPCQHQSYSFSRAQTSDLMNGRENFSWAMITVVWGRTNLSSLTPISKGCIWAGSRAHRRLMDISQASTSCWFNAEKHKTSLVAGHVNDDTWTYHWAESHSDSINFSSLAREQGKYMSAGEKTGYDEDSCSRVIFIRMWNAIMFISFELIHQLVTFGFYKS